MWKEIIEGKTKLFVPEEMLEGTIVRKPIFYNPRSKLSRDVSCAVLRSLAQERKLKYLDLLAGTGARGIRVAKEAGCNVHLNDVSAKSVEAIKRNAELNGVSLQVSNSEANAFLTENNGVFDFIDIDPYGSPSPYLENAILTVKRDGFIAFAATDTAALNGLYPKVSFRRYSALPLRCEFSKEVGLRILLGYAARTAAQHQMDLRFLLSHSTAHYFRVYLRLDSEKGAADSALKEIGYLYYCRNCLDRKTEIATIATKQRCECGGEYEIAGPLWLGNIRDKEFCGLVLKESRYLADADLEKLLSTLINELEVPFYFDMHVLSKKLKTSSPKIEKMIEMLRSSGFDATRSHFSPTAIKTNADVKEVKRAFYQSSSS